MSVRYNATDKLTSVRIQIVFPKDVSDRKVVASLIKVVNRCRRGESQNANEYCNWVFLNHLPVPKQNATNLTRQYILFQMTNKHEAIVKSDSQAKHCAEQHKAAGYL